MAKSQAPDQRTAMLSEGDTNTAARVRMIVGVVVLGLLILFLLQNLQSTEIHFLWFSWSMRVIWALLGAAVGGALVSLVASTVRRRRANRTNV
ncbi:MAG TPA: LapA family protein [Dehalococcoidia bacterium]|nr:LapA family protein [Dehalococcoidia bacterium]